MSKGKCWSQVNKGQRKESDFYQTPYKLTESLFKNEDFDFNKIVLEPACGDGAIVRILNSYFTYKNVESYDLKIHNIDFLKDCPDRKYDYIITNPPFSIANEFIIKAKEICTIKFAFLMKLNYLQGQWRYKNIFNKYDNFPLTKVYVFTRMPTFESTIREDGKYETGMQATAWYIWEKIKYETISQPIIRWISSEGQTVNKEDRKGE